MSISSEARSAAKKDPTATYFKCSFKHACKICDGRIRYITNRSCIVCNDRGKTSPSQDKERRAEEMYSRAYGDSERSDLNPFNQKTEILEFHAWSAGHFDKWGRV